MLEVRRVACLMLVSLLAACGGGGVAMTPSGKVIDPPIFSGTFELPARTQLATAPYPDAGDGVHHLVFPTQDGPLAFDPKLRTPITAASECAAAVLACYAPGQRNWPGCLLHVPVCRTATPWVGDDPMCCPAACAPRYQELRAAGEDGPSAFTHAVFGKPSCTPGLAEFQP
jgi:hypothetical protein